MLLLSYNPLPPCTSLTLWLCVFAYAQVVKLRHWSDAVNVLNTSCKNCFYAKQLTSMSPSWEAEGHDEHLRLRWATPQVALCHVSFVCSSALLCYVAVTLRIFKHPILYIFMQQTCLKFYITNLPGSQRLSLSPELSLITQNTETCTSERPHLKGVEESTKSVARPAADVLIVQFNILLKCQVACGGCQSNKTDTDRGRNPSLTFIIHILSLENSLHLCLISWPGKGHTCPHGQEPTVERGTPWVHRPDLCLVHSWKELYTWICLILQHCLLIGDMASQGIQDQLQTGCSASPSALLLTWLSLRPSRWGESGNFFSVLCGLINAEGSLLNVLLYWSIWTF